jgi:hypothetical protein
MVCFTCLSLLLPQPSQAGGGAEFERLRTQLTGNVEGLVEALLGFLFNLRLGIFDLGL